MIVDIDSVYSFHQIGKRDNQEDSRFPDVDHPDNQTPVFVVCDGVGGCEKGEVASQTVCRSIGEVMDRHNNLQDFSDGDFQYVLRKAYEALDKASNPSNRGMGTTLTFLTPHSQGVLAAHIGDSRIYQIRPQEGIIYRSEDHSLVNALLRSGNISPEQVKGHPKSNVITRCMSANDGVRDRDEATVVNLQDISPDDYFILCSDGVTSVWDDEELIDLYSSDKTDEEKIKILAERSSESDDNNTAIQIHVGLVTVDPEIETELEIDSDEEKEGEEENVVVTQKLRRKDETSHDLSAETVSSGSKIKSFFSRLFK